MGVEPVQGVDGFGDLVAGAAAQAVGLAGEADEGGFDFEEFQGGIVLLGFGNGSAEVFLAGHEKSRRLHVFHLRNYGALHVVVRVLPWIGAEPVLRAKGGEVGSEDPAIPIDDRIEAGGSSET